ncbi:guanylate kinase [Candidatus Pacearchaeota archaeon]|nr:guanylate kinase [Candidatus Pacearchaeota archaeon]
MSGKLFIVSAPSGAGKTTLVDSVLKKISSEFSIGKVVTYTSRAPRTGEVSGQDYHFVSSLEFEQHIKESFFLEWSGEYGNYYGTPRYIVDELDQGFSRILIIDMLGTQNLISISNDKTPFLTNCVVPIWIHTSDIKQLKERLIARGENTLEQIKRRLDLARQELKKEKSSSLYKYRVLNDDFSKAIIKFQTILIAELSR